MICLRQKYGPDQTQRSSLGDSENRRNACARASLRQREDDRRAAGPALTQVANVACLRESSATRSRCPTFIGATGFPSAALRLSMPAKVSYRQEGSATISIAACAWRVTNLQFNSVEPKIDRLADALFNRIPAGVGSEGAIPGLSIGQLKDVVRKGANRALRNGYANERDIEHTEEGGMLAGADPDRISERAYQRGSKQLGTLGSGNHSLEVSRVDEIYDSKVADALGLELGQVTVLIHSGSRGLGHQTCDDYLKLNTRCDGPLRNPPARSPACRLSNQLAGGASASRCDSRRCELCLVQPTGNDASRGASVLGSALDYAEGIDLRACV